MVSLCRWGSGETVQYRVSFLLRDFHNRDFETLWRIDQECFAPGISYSQAELAAYMNVSGSFTIVAQAGGEQAEGVEPEILGFVVANLNRVHAGHIVTIDVLPKARRSGVGSALLHAAEVRLISQGCRQVRLEAAVDNVQALHFYKRHQYFVMRTIPGYYPNGMDAFLMKKDLLSSPRAS